MRTLTTLLASMLLCGALAWATITPVSVVPGSGNSLSATFAVTVADTAGVADLTEWDLSIGGYTSACYVRYYQPHNSLSLLKDDGSNWVPNGGNWDAGEFSVGTGSSVSNSQCTMDTLHATRVISGNQVTINIPITFKIAFAGNRGISLHAFNSTGTDTGWVNMGTPYWNVPASGTIITVVSAVPGSGNTSTATFAYTITDTAGYGDLATTYLSIGGYTNACYVRYYQPHNSLSLLKDDGSNWVPNGGNWDAGEFSVGTGSSVSNSQCTLNTAAASSTRSGNQVTVNIPVTFLPAFAGNRGISGYAENTSGTYTEWVNLGTPYWTVPSGPPTITTVSVVDGISQPGDIVTDTYSGSTMTMPSAAGPAPAIKFTTSTGAAQNMHAADTWTLTVFHAPAWVPVYSSFAIWSTVDQSFIAFGCWAPGNAGITLMGNNNTPCQIGYTDSTGYFATTGRGTNIPLGYNYVESVFDSATWTDDNLVGTHSFVMYAPGGGGAVSNANNGVAAMMSIALKRNRTYQHPSAKNIEVAAVRATRTPGPNKRTSYEFTVDTRQADLIRIGDDIRYRARGESLTLQNGWASIGIGWFFIEGAVRSENSKFTLESDWLPGPVAVMVQGVSEPFDMQEDSLDNMLIATATNIQNDSVRRVVIGPAIKPGSTPAELQTAIKNWVSLLNLGFLIPMTKEGIDLAATLDTLTPATDFETEIVSCLRDAINAQK